MTLDRKTIAIIVMGIIIIILITNKCQGEKTPSVKETVKTVISYITVIDSAKTSLIGQKPEKVPFIVYKDRIVKDTTGHYFIKPNEEAELMTLNVYKDTLKLDNAEVFSEITTDGKVYDHKVKAKTTEKTITITNTKEMVINGSGLFMSGGGGINNGMGLDNINLGLDYIHKNDVGIGANVQYNFTTKEPVFGFRILKKIF